MAKQGYNGPLERVGECCWRIPKTYRLGMRVEGRIFADERLIAMGANIKHVPGLYWDFWDHQVPFTENSLSEGLRVNGFSIDLCVGRFLPYTMSSERRYPLVFVKLYLALPFLWRLFGRQFLVIARK